jgi:fucose 4-O-acetylase-like acetyltransferase
MNNLAFTQERQDTRKTMKDKRNKQLDGVKGFGIILVVLGHIVVYSNPENFRNNLLFNLIYSFHMPLFFFLSGYLAFDLYDRPTITWITRKFVQLVIPYSIFTFFYFFVLFGPSVANITPVRIVYALFAYTKSDSAWFLPVLFESLLILSVFVNVEKAVGEYSFVGFFLLVCCVIPLTRNLKGIPAIHQIFVGSPFVISGYLARKYRKRFAAYMTSIEVVGSALFIVLFCLRNGSFLATINNYLFHLYYFYAQAAAGIILSWSIIKLLINYKISYLFIFCGKLTMELYLTHLIILNYFTFRHWPIWFGSGIVAILSGTIWLLTLSDILSLILSYNRKVSAIIFGRWSFGSMVQL